MSSLVEIVLVEYTRKHNHSNKHTHMHEAFFFKKKLHKCINEIITHSKFDTFD